MFTKFYAWRTGSETYLNLEMLSALTRWPEGSERVPIAAVERILVASPDSCQNRGDAHPDKLPVWVLQIFGDTFYVLDDSESAGRTTAILAIKARTVV